MRDHRNAYIRTTMTITMTKAMSTRMTTDITTMLPPEISKR